MFLNYISLYIPIFTYIDLYNPPIDIIGYPTLIPIWLCNPICWYLINGHNIYIYNIVQESSLYLILYEGYLNDPDYFPITSY